MNVGDYCYIKGKSRDYGIGKIVQLNSGYSSNGGELIDILFKHSEHAVPKKDVISSPQIIDLIQCNDYVNGYKVIGIVKGFKILVDKLELDTTTGLCHHKSIMAKNIKTIVTHEQMEAMQYRVEE